MWAVLYFCYANFSEELLLSITLIYHCTLPLKHVQSEHFKLKYKLPSL